MSLKKLLLKTSITRKIYLYYNLYIRNKAYKKRNSYSQWGEDQIIKDFFKDNKKGFYVDIGCFHPILLSKSNLLKTNRQECLMQKRQKQKWQGVLMICVKVFSYFPFVT